MHLRLPELRAAPAPFLNRFEKYRLTHCDLLNSMLDQAPAMRSLTTKVSERVDALLECLGLESFYGARKQQTVESILLDLISTHIIGSTTKISDAAALRSLQELDGPVIVQAREELRGD